MRLSSLAIIAGVFGSAGALSFVTAHFSANMVEAASKSGVLNALDRAELTWAEVDVNGLQVFLIGTAPDEASRFQALSTAGTVVDAARVIDQMLVEETEAIVAPAFSLEILRNKSGLSVIGLVPASTDRASLQRQLQALAGEEGAVSDLLETADFPAPDTWDDSVHFAMRALEDLPRSKISVNADRVMIRATTESEEERRRLEVALARRAPENVRLGLELSSPRPVISPFAFRMRYDEDGPRLDTCSADSEEARDRIFAALANAGMEGKISCTLGLGVPSRRWGEAVAQSVGALTQLGGGSLAITNADIELVALEGTVEALFETTVSDLGAALPPVFALNAVLPEPPDANAEGPPDFSATLSPEGAVQIRGRIESEVAKQTADSFARAAFGSESVYTATRLSDKLPADWSVRTLAGLEALSMLANGAVTVTPDSVTVRGRTGRKDAQDAIAALFTEKLGADSTLDISVEYVEQFDASLGLPTPEECEAQIVQIIGDRKITFEPGSAALDNSAEDILDELADLLKKCGDIPLEIGGHTDSQGSESGNQRLSQSRAQSVLDALRARLVPVRAYSVQGYGEANPIADNGTEDGREANRRIEFKLLRPEPIAEEQTTLEALAEAEGDAVDNEAALETVAQDGESEDTAGDADEETSE
ncbi:OmpA family protein [Cognatishimia sp. F0-27]|uniref:OmpA family protein n=1 Tax=Cognatishimia sp. F0-27 TaxID=2816855 RepID=UPI001D0CC375|nr:OmpA family protein [Cognatishimia sp. F0-27]MCC1494437.1 OmpA family protein [Cognatishimia sp. F0-27]